MCFVIQSSIIFVLNPVFLFVYVPLIFVFIIFSPITSKNILRENNTMSYGKNFVFLVSAFLASLTPSLINFENSIFGATQLLTITTITSIALPLSSIQMLTLGQRVSIREHLKFTDDLFKKQKESWKEKVASFPNYDEIIQNFDQGKYIPDLFDRGSFNLVILWSCIFMEKIIDASIEGIVSKNHEVESFFKRKNGSRKSYPVKLKNLTFGMNSNICNKKEGITSEFLWHSLRNDIAHRNTRPTFTETYATLCYLLTFIQEMPNVLQEWKREKFLK